MTTVVSNDAQAECIRALKSWGWKNAVPIGSHFVAAYHRTPVDGSLVAWCAPALLAANAEAQRRFRDMLAAKSYPDPDAAETQAYVAAERVVDRLLAEAQAPALAEGDHFEYPVGAAR